MAEVLPSDLVEQILILLDVEGLIRCKSVCKSWQSLISSPRFVKAQLNHAHKNDRNNHQIGHRRIGFGLSSYSMWESIILNVLRVVGSFNGLVCVSPRDVELELTNPSTREYKKLPPPPYLPDMDKFAVIRQAVCWGFGYDSSTDDYKAIAGFRKTFSVKRTRFYAFSLKQNTWKLIGQVKYRCFDSIEGILCCGALHWFMDDAKKKVIISLDLTTHKFKEIPQPTNYDEYECHVDDDHRLGVIEDCLCIYSSRSPNLSRNIWVLKSNKWEPYNNDDHCGSKYDVTHYVQVNSQKTTNHVYRLSDAEHLPSVGHSMRGSIFVKSLVSPHLHFNNYDGQVKEPEGAIRKRTRNMMVEEEEVF